MAQTLLHLDLQLLAVVAVALTKAKMALLVVDLLLELQLVV
jgi:hypothetical protein